MSRSLLSPHPLRSAGTALLAALLFAACASPETPPAEGNNAVNNNTVNNSTSGNNNTANNNTANNNTANNNTANNNNTPDEDAGNNTLPDEDAGANNNTPGEDAGDDAAPDAPDAPDDNNTPQAPAILSFTADRGEVLAGGQVTLRWETTGAETVTITTTAGEDPGAVSATGEQAVAIPETATLTLTASNAGGEVTAEVEVTAVPLLALTSPEAGAALPPATIGVPYAATFAAEGGRAPLTWSVEGDLPDGLTLDAAAGSLSGTPTAHGEWSLTLQVSDGFEPPQTATRATVLRVAPEGLAILTDALPAGRVGEPYAATLQAEGGAAPITWSANGLPQGLLLAPDGALTGTPAAHGESNVRITATDAAGQTAEVTLTISVAPTLLVLTTEALPAGNVGQPYDQLLTAGGGVAPLTWTVTGLPAGLSASPAGRITGTPSATATAQVTVEVRDSAGQTAGATLPLDVREGAPTITTAALQDAQQGQPYSATLEAAGGDAPYTWTVVSGVLPAGLQLAASGLLSGTPTGSGTSMFRVQATGSNGLSAERELSLLVQATPLVISTGSMLPNANLGAPYDVALTATGGLPPYSWEATASALPSGLSLSEDGHLAGTPTTGGPAAITARVTDSGTPPQQLERTFTFTVTAEPLAWTTAPTLPEGMTGQGYSATLQTSGGAGGTTYTITGGALPYGLQLNANGLLSGAPNTPGDATFTVEARDSAGATIQRSFSLTIRRTLPTDNPHHLIAGSFVDISPTATALTNASNEDDGEDLGVAIGFPFVFYGQIYEQMNVGANGALSFVSTDISAVNGAIPNPSAPNGFIAPFWDDLQPVDSGDVYVQTRGAAPWRQTIIQWKDVALYSDNSLFAKVNAEVILYETTHEIQFIYDHSRAGDAATLFGHTGASATLGIESPDGTRGVEIAFNQPNTASAGQTVLLSPEGLDYSQDGWEITDGDFVNIASTGAVLPFTANADDADLPITLPFNFPFYTSSTNQLRVSTNGHLSFGAFPTGSYNNTNLPGAASYPGGIIAVLWDDLILRDGSRILTQTLGAAPNRRFVVQWDRVSRIAETDTRLTFQAILYEGSGDIALRYGTLNFASSSTNRGSSATVGIQSPDGASGLTLSNNLPSIRPGAAAWFTPDRATARTTYEGGGLSDNLLDARDEPTVQRLAIDQEDDSFEAVTLPFPVTFYGQTYTTLYVTSNGFASFTPLTFAAAVNDALPNTSAPNALLAPFWDDLDPPLDSGRGRILTATRGVAPDRLFIVQWHDVPHNNDATQSVTTQLVLSEADSTILFNYGPLFTASTTSNFANLSSATLGVEDPTGTRGTSLGVNQANTVRSGGQVRVLDASR